MRRAWRDEARTAIEALQEARYGDRETILRSLARKFGNESDDPSSLRRGIAAYEFLERLRKENPIVYASLDGVSLSIAELLARWHAQSPEQALKAAAEWRSGRATVQTIRKAMSEQMPRAPGGKVGAAFDRAFRQSATEVVAKALNKLVEAEVVLVNQRDRDSQSGIKFDYLFEIGSEPARRVAVLVVGPYNNRMMYRDRCDEWIIRAFGTAWVFDRVVLAIPNKEYVPTYRERAKLIVKSTAARIGPNSDVSPNVEVIHIEVDFLDPIDSDALSQLAR